ncbi:MAG TPA: adenosylcobinamide-GDP ribazoletransferase [Clostridiales bacterium]|nr:adenosylcobinamide-GDP ribazoletransferase [Clostridiales bacterium]
MKSFLKSFILMLQFFTRIPIPISIDMEKKAISRGILFFPIVGMLVGIISWGIYYILSFLNRDMAALGAVMGAVAVTGGLHVDGLSDTCDGFFSARSRERILEIMKDSRAGTFGVIAICLDLLARYAVIKDLPQDAAITAFVVIFGASRLGAALMITFGKSARPGGLGEMFSSSSNKLYFFISFFAYALICAVSGGFQAVICLVAVLFVFLLLMRYSYKIIGGLTGDVYGAGIELSEIAGLIVFIGVEKWISFL